MEYSEGTEILDETGSEIDPTADLTVPAIAIAEGTATLDGTMSLDGIGLEIDPTVKASATAIAIVGGSSQVDVNPTDLLLLSRYPG